MRAGAPGGKMEAWRQEGCGAMRARTAAVLAVLMAAASITVAVVIHRQVILCSYLGGQPPPPCSRPTDYPLDLRLGIVAGGLVVAALIMAISRRSRKRRKTRTSF